jgi:hypothetical protein
MTAVRDFVDISAGHAVPSNIEHADMLGLRETLGRVYVDPDFRPQLAEAKRRNPNIVSLGYPFLTGPKRSASIEQQIAFWAAHHQADLGALDWERDIYRTGDTVVHDMGIQPFGNVLRGLELARARGIDAGVYMSLYLASSAVVDALIARKTPLLWIAAYGLDLPQWLVAKCSTAGVVLIHQYEGDTIDRNRVEVGSLEQLHALAGRPPASGDAPKPHDPGVTPVKFGTIYDPPKSLDVPRDTSVRDFTGVEFDKVGPTKLRVYGKADAHDAAFIVKVHTGHFYSDGTARDSYAVAIVPGGTPE